MQNKDFKKVAEDIILYLYRKDYKEEEKEAQRRIMYLLNKVCEEKETYERVVKILKKENII